MKKLTNFSVNYPVTVLMVVLAVSLLGIISYQKLGIDLFPNLKSPRIFIELKSGESPPEELENLYVDNIESLAMRQSDVVEVSSVTRTGSSQITVEYAWGKDMDEAFLDLQKALTSLAQNTDIDELVITQHDPNTSPIMVVGLSHESIKDMNELRKVAESYIRNELVRLEGIAEVELSGYEESEVRIETDEYRLESFNLTLENLSQRIQAFNRNLSGGSIVDMGLQYIVKGVSLLQDEDDFNKLIVGTVDEDGRERTPIFLAEVADVSFINKRPDNIVRLNGQRCVGLSIFKEARFNTVTAVNDLLKALERIEKALPGYKFDVISNQGAFINGAINEVKETLLAGILLAVIVLFLFLRRVGTTLIISMAIPISIIATFNLMYFNGLTLNIMTLGGLALGAGMLVDNAIVVMENIFRNHEGGMSAREAAVTGASQVGGAITASTLSTIVVFLPIVYLHGASGELFKEQAWTVAFSLLSSLFVAVFFIPMVYKFFYHNREIKSEKRSVQLIGYSNFLHRMLSFRWAIMFAALALIVLAGLLLPYVGSEFMPKSDTREFSMEIKLPEGTPLERTSLAVGSMEVMIQELLEEDVEAVYSRIGPSSGLSSNEQSVFEGENTAEIKVVLKSGSKHKSQQIIEVLSEWYSDHPQFDVRFVQDETALQTILGVEGAPIVIEVKGDNMEVIEGIVRQVVDKVETIPGMFNFSTNIEDGYPELNVMIDRYKTGLYNLSVDDILDQISAQLEGKGSGQMEKEGEMIDITVRTPEVDMSAFSNFSIRSGDQVVRIDDVATLTEGVSPKEIYHRNQSRVGKVMANLSKGAVLDKVVAQIHEEVASISMPTEYSMRIEGEEQKRRESIGNLKFALLLSIVLVYMVLASQFESLVQPFIVLLTIPMSIVGSILIFFIIGLPLNIMAIIGIIMLVGIAVNDSIIFVDRINQLRARGIEKREAIALAGQQRIRPIIMTSLTTVLALLPLTFGFGESASLRSPMALAVIGGLVTSTLLSLMVIPSVYDIFTKERLKYIESE